MSIQYWFKHPVLFLYSLNLWWYYWLSMVKSSIILWTNRQIAERPTILHVKGWAFVILNRDTTNSEPLYLWNVPIKCFWSFHNAVPFQPWCQHKIQRKTWMCIYKNQWCWSATTCIVCVLFSLELSQPFGVGLTLTLGIFGTICTYIITHNIHSPYCSWWSCPWICRHSGFSKWSNHFGPTHWWCHRVLQVCSGHETYLCSTIPARWQANTK